MYLASFPFLVWVIGGEALFDVWWYYRPIEILREGSETFDQVYTAYLDLFPEEIWQ
jgi:hypothetical protein